MRCKELMIQSPVFCGPMASAANVAQLMTDRNIAKTATSGVNPLTKTYNPSSENFRESCPSSSNRR
jgi:hypothetical protein